MVSQVCNAALFRFSRGSKRELSVAVSRAML